MSSSVQPRRKSRFRLSTIPRLASWQLRETWFLLLFTTLGMVAAVVIVCAIPLLYSVMTTAGLRQTLRATPYSSDIEVYTQTAGISTPIVQDIHQKFDSILYGNLGNLLTPQLSVITTSNFSPSPEQKGTSLTVYGTSMQQAASHFGSLQGSIAHITSNPANELEVMMTPDSAQHLGVHLGSTLPLQLKYNIINSQSEYTARLTARVVGIFSVTAANASYWYGNNFTTLRSESSTVSTLLVSQNALLSLFDHIRNARQSDAVYTTSYIGYTLYWHYSVNAARIDSSQLDMLISQFANVQSTTDSLYGSLENGRTDLTLVYPYLTAVSLTSPLLSPANSQSSLEQFRSRIDVAHIPVGIFAVLILSLVLFFVSLMTTLLIDRQSDTIAILRSRGASTGQVFSSLLLQSVCLGLLGLLIGLPVAAYAAILLSQRLLAPTEQDALNILAGHPFATMLSTFWYGLAIALIALLTMSVSLFLASRLNVLSIRRDSARSSKRPLWQRLNLDVLAGGLALVGYALSLYVTSIGSVIQGDAKVLLATPLSIIAPFFLIIGCLFLFLRLFPWLLRLGVRMAARGRGAAPLLAFAQMARSPRQSLRMTLLLSLATSFALFTLIFSATQSQHIQQIVTYQTGADFSVQVAPSQSSPVQITGLFRAIPGVLTASIGFSDKGIAGTADLPVELRAVDAANFGQTVIWPSQADYQAARPLLATLVADRPTTTINNMSSDIVPVIVDQITLNKLLLHVNESFTVTVSDLSIQQIHCLIVGVVNYIPTINNRLAFSGSNGSVSILNGGVLFDYQTFTDAYQYDVAHTKNARGLSTHPDISQVWLHTGSDVASLASVRTALLDTKYRATHIADRRLLLSTLQSDPLYLILNGMLAIGTVTALLLALLGDLLVTWLGTRLRLVSFVTLRALGTTSRQITSVLTWEQAIVYITGFVLGGAFGLLLATSVIPSLTLTDINSNLSNEQLFALQSALGTQLVAPPSLILVIILGVAIYALALSMMVFMVSRPALGQTLRLSED